MGITRCQMEELRSRLLRAKHNTGTLDSAIDFADKCLREADGEEKKVADIIEWGQGYDDVIIELIQAFQRFRDGYYSLINYGDDWWRSFNQSIEFDNIMSKEWEAIDDGFMEHIETMAIAIAGTYVIFDKFADGAIQAYENGYGFRHKEKQNDRTGNSKEVN